VGSISEDFEVFFAEAEPRLRRALIAAYGFERGREAAADALAYGWEHWEALRAMKSPIGYLYRVGQNHSRQRKAPVLFASREERDPWVEPKLPAALAQLSERQRLAVVLVHGYGWRLTEVAEMTGMRVTTVQTHVERGLTRLRNALEVHDHA
jgi:RNA polymerase sigma factor (sigma-70 family)